METRSTGIWLVSVGLLAYSAAVHLGVVGQRPLLALLLLLGLVISFLYRPLRQGNVKAWLAIPVLVVIAGLAWRSDRLLYVLYLPPVLINSALALVFASTLLPGSTPLITQFSMIMKGELDEKALKYTRRVTEAWVACFALLAVQSLLLALYAPPVVWSFFTNFGNYLLVALFFVVEYRVRVASFREVDHPGFFGFIVALLRLDMRGIKIR